MKRKPFFRIYPILFFAINFLSFIKAYCQPSPRESYPKITITNWFNVRQKVEITKKFIVLDFWATWCAPCLASIPHINALQKRFQNNQKIVFISLTDERPQKITSFLSQMHFSSLVATDTSKSTLRSFGVETFPTTYLIDQNGKIRWKGESRNLSFKLISRLLSKDSSLHIQSQKQERNTNLDSVYSSYRKIFNKDSIISYFSCSEPTKQYLGKSLSRIGLKQYNIVQVGVKITAVLARLFKCSENQIEIPPNLRDKNISYCFKSQVNFNQDSCEIKLVNDLLNFSRLKINVVDSMREVFLISVIDSNKIKRYKASIGVQSNLSGYSTSDGDKIITFRNSKFIDIENILTAILKKNIIFDNNNNNNNRYDLIFNNSSLDKLQNSFQEYGLDIHKSLKVIKSFKIDSL